MRRAVILACAIACALPAQATAAPAKTMLAAETALGRTPAEASRRARKCAQARDRVFKGRRAGVLSRSS